MATDAPTFVSEDLWLFVAIATFFLAGVLAILGLQTVVALVTFVGWFFLTPVFLFWGEEISAWLYGTDDENRRQVAREGDTNRDYDYDRDRNRTRQRDPPDDPLEQLKHRYATGELSDAEFEHRLERLIEVDDRYERRDGRDAADPSAVSDRSDREFERERT
ncbi:SHOCT domain-containing protein [Natrialbaceae archaeon A-CW1-1]